MLLKLKEFLKGNISLSEKEIKDIRDYFNEVLNYNEMDTEKPVDILEDIYNTFKDIYSYSGAVYRGVFIDTSWNEYEDNYEISSFSSNKNVAENFAMRGDNGDCYLITQEVCNELDFGMLLNDLHDKDILLTDDVQTFLGEDEILCYVQKNCTVNKICTLY